MNDKLPTRKNPSVISAAYPTNDSLPRLQERRKRNIILVGLALILLLIVTIIELKYIGSHSIGVLALFNLNIILLLVLLLLIFRNIIKMVIERRQQTAGSHFRAKLVFAFVVLSMIPTVFLVVVGSNLMADAVKSWFNPQIDQFVNSAMDIARQSHAFADSYLTNSTRMLAQAMSTDQLLMDDKREQLMKLLNTRQMDYNLALIQLFDVHGMEIWRGLQREFSSSVFFDPGDPYFAGVLDGNEFVKIIALTSGEMIQKGVPVYDIKNPGAVQGVLVANLFLPQEISHGIRSIQRDYEAYKRQKLSIPPTQGLYISIFVTLSLNILFAAIWLGLYIARQISTPISYLVQATDQVAGGNLDFRIDILAFDEIGRLVNSFNHMTEQLKANKDLIDRTTRELRETNLEIRRRQNQLETILRNIGAGVISLDLNGNITSWNHKIATILDIGEAEALNRNYRDVLRDDSLSEFRNVLQIALDRPSREIKKDLQIQIHARVTTCSVTSAPQLDADDQFCGIVVVVDDLTQFVRVQRIAAWREVARRLAHEIKNPLTPIQLHAQRLQRKFEQKSDDFTEVFSDATNSIINEVNGLRYLLDEFSQFARFPEPHFQKGKLQDVIDQALSLYSGTHDQIEIRTRLDQQLPEISMDHDQMKRVFINLMDNAIEAMQGKGSILVESEFDESLRIIRISVSDDGPGIPEGEREKIFLPHFSTKERGSGLGLAICNRIITDHNGIIRVQDSEPTGARFVIDLPVYFEEAGDPAR